MEDHPIIQTALQVEHHSDYKTSKSCLDSFLILPLHIQLVPHFLVARFQILFQTFLVFFLLIVHILQFLHFLQKHLVVELVFVSQKLNYSDVYQYASEVACYTILSNGFIAFGSSSNRSIDVMCSPNFFWVAFPANPLIKVAAAAD